MGDTQQEFIELVNKFQCLSLLFLNTFLSMIFSVFQKSNLVFPSSLSANVLTSFPVRKTQGNIRQENSQLFFLPYTSTSASIITLRIFRSQSFLLKINPIPVFSVKRSLSAIIGLITLSMFISYIPLAQLFTLLMCLFYLKKQIGFPSRNNSIFLQLPLLKDCYLVLFPSVL